MKQKGFAPVLIILVLLGAGVLAYFSFVYKTPAGPSPTPPITEEPVATSSPPTNPTANWKTYKDVTLGIEYKLPPKLRATAQSGTKMQGDTGTQYCVIYSGSVSSFVRTVLAGGGPCWVETFALGSVTRDYSAGREGGFGDFTGYVISNGQYYPRFIDTQSSYALPKNLIIEKTNSNGVKYLRITGDNSVQDYGGDMMDIPIPGTPGKGYMGALVNLNNSAYAGFNIQMATKSNSDVEIFDQILSTFKFITSAQTPTPNPVTGWKTYSISEFSFKYPSDWRLDTGGKVIYSPNSTTEIYISGINDPMYNECMVLGRTVTEGDKMIKYYSYSYSGEACSNKDELGTYEAWITKAGGDGFSPGIIYRYNTTAYPTSYEIFKALLSTFKFNQ